MAKLALEALSEAGVPASWSGEPNQQVEILPFFWARRRFSARPDGVPDGPTPWETAHRQPRLLPPPSEDVLADWRQEVTAYRTTYAFDTWLSEVMRAAWEQRLHGERGQMGHHGLLHAFVRAGHTTVMQPVDALLNLHPERAAELVARGRAARPTTKRPWWKLWG